MLADFYSRRLEGVHDIRTLKKKIKERGGDGFLRLKEDDVIQAYPDGAELELFPDSLSLGDTDFRVTYNFAPGKEKDGATIAIPASRVSRVRPEQLEWGVPGMFREKITALIKGLPKRYRKQLVPVTGTVEVILKEMQQKEGSLLACLSEFVYRRFAVDIPASVWSSVEIPEYLAMRVAVTDPRGRELESGRDIRLLGREGKHSAARETTGEWKAARIKWEREDVKKWDFGELPESIALGPHQHAYPALAREKNGVNLRLFHTREEALKSHRSGVQSLFCLSLVKDLKYLKRSLKIKDGESPGSAYFGGAEQVVIDLYENLVKRLF
jgi:ATP-dependent helicase HrpA